jgi:hypothetical protein
MRTYGRLVGMALLAVGVGACSSDTAPKGSSQETGGVWVANNGGTSISEFTVAQLDSSAELVPADTIGGLENTAGVAVDGSGNVWVAAYGLDTLWMYSLSQQTGGGSPTPTVKIVSPSLSDPEEIAFDASGTLWVADYDNGLVGFTKSQLAASGTVTAAYTITDGSEPEYWQIAFDKGGNLWVDKVGSPGSIEEFTPSQLTASGTVTPTTTITPSVSGSLYGLAFDGSGNLWAVYETVAAEIAQSALGSSGTVTPAVTITLPAGAEGFGATFDKHGTLWVSDDDENKMYGYQSSQLTASGSAAPAITLSGNGFNEPEQMAFDGMAPAPTPAGSRVARPLAARAAGAWNPNAHRVDK